MVELSSEHKRFIVESLACYDTPAMIIADLKERYGVAATPSQITYYNPESAQGKRELAEEWKQLFAQRRETFMSEAEAVPIANLAFRLRRLQRIVDSSKADKMPIVVKDVLKQVAQDVGGVFTNKREISGPGGKAIEVTTEAREQAAKELDAWRRKQAENLPGLLSEPPP